MKSYNITVPVVANRKEYSLGTQSILDNQVITGIIPNVRNAYVSSEATNYTGAGLESSLIRKAYLQLVDDANSVLHDNLSLNLLDQKFKADGSLDYLDLKGVNWQKSKLILGAIPDNGELSKEVSFQVFYKAKTK